MPCGVLQNHQLFFLSLNTHLQPTIFLADRGRTRNHVWFLSKALNSTCMALRHSLTLIALEKQVGSKSANSEINAWWRGYLTMPSVSCLICRTLLCDLVRIGCSLGGARSRGWTRGTFDSAWIDEELGGEWERLEFIGKVKEFGGVEPETLAWITRRVNVLEVGRFGEDGVVRDVLLKKGNSVSWKITSRDINIHPDSGW